MCLLDRRVVVVTGASGNLGSAVARAARAAGARTALVDRDHARLAAAHADVASSRDHVLEAVDLADRGAVEALVARVTDALGPPTGLVNTVGGYRAGDPVGSSEWSTWESMMALNVRPTLECARAVLPAMRRAGRGSIVNVASLAGLAADPEAGAYAAAKAAVLRLGEALAAEVKADGVRVNAVLPGSLDTPQNRAWMSSEQVATAIDPRALADVVVFLLSDASRAVTGASIRVTGRQ
jgi:NAD(P)-dependent dehydrogenase (short-subunit alcohol dehydrogenase family)